MWAAQRDGRPVAVKIIRPNASAAHAEAIRRETRIGPLIAEHPGVVAVRRAEAIGGALHLEMEVVSGPSLAQIIQGRLDARMGGLPASIAIPWVVGILETLDWVGRVVAPQQPNSFVHRDIKPANLLLDPTGRVRITDFGIARAEANLGFLTTSTGVVKGSPRFMAPEVIREQTPDARADQFSAAVVLFELIVGAPLYEGRDLAEVLLKAVTADVEKRMPLLMRVPPAAVAVIRRMLARNPADRFPTHGEAARALAAVPLQGPRVAEWLPDLLAFAGPDDPFEDASPPDRTNELTSEDEGMATDPGLVPHREALPFLGPRDVGPQGLHRPSLQTFNPTDDPDTRPGTPAFDELDPLTDIDDATDEADSDTPSAMPLLRRMPSSGDPPTQIDPRRGRRPLPRAPVHSLRPLPIEPPPLPASEAETAVMSRDKLLAEAAAEGLADVDPAIVASGRRHTPPGVQRRTNSGSPPRQAKPPADEPWLVVISLLVVLLGAAGAVAIVAAAAWWNIR